MSGRFESKDHDSVELSSADGDDVSSYTPPRQIFGDYETEFPTVGATVRAANGQSDDSNVYDTQTFRIPEGAYTMDTMPL